MCIAVYSLGFQILLPSVLSCLVAGRLGEPQHFLKGVPMLGATPASPPGFKLRFRSEYWEVLCTRHNWHLQFRPSIGNGGQEEQSVFGSSSLRSRWWLWGVPAALLHVTLREMQWRWVVVFCGPSCNREIGSLGSGARWPEFLAN